MEYTDGAGRTHRKIVAPAKIFVDEGVYYAAVWTDVAAAIPADKADLIKTAVRSTRGTGRHLAWQVLRLSRIEHADIMESAAKLDIPDAPVAELRAWGFDNGTAAVFITDRPHLQFIKKLPDATVEPCGEGEKVHLTVSSDSWFVAFCISHARRITSVAPETLRTMIVARAERELAVEQADGERTAEE
jgi:predicted DNA-binding transcriptional regulator YafY